MAERGKEKKKSKNPECLTDILEEKYSRLSRALLVKMIS
jgi:hypothetical protein